MTVSFKRGGYEQWIRARGHHIDYNCGCIDFQMRKLNSHKRDGKELIPCKHLVPILGAVDINFCVGFLGVTIK